MMLCVARNRLLFSDGIHLHVQITLGCAQQLWKEAQHRPELVTQKELKLVERETHQHTIYANKPF